MVGGVPGAGKSTAIRAVALACGVPVVDPDQVRTWLARRLPAGTPYRRYRPLVHVVHTLRVLAAVAAGGDRVLVVHDPSTRPARRVLFARLARAAGWRPTLVLVDATRSSARAGQLRRGRVVDPDSFDRHWQRWQVLRSEVLGGRGPSDAADWDRLLLVDRSAAPDTLRQLCAEPGQRERLCRDDATEPFTITTGAAGQPLSRLG